MPLLDIAFLENFIKEWGFWALTGICMTPMLAFMGYVWWYDARQARLHPHDHH